MRAQYPNLAECRGERLGERHGGDDDDGRDGTVENGNIGCGASARGEGEDEKR